VYFTNFFVTILIVVYIFNVRLVLYIYCVLFIRHTSNIMFAVIRQKKHKAKRMVSSGIELSGSVESARSLD
jgi:hypothetical protein